jgi:hypothetical protein
MAVIRRDAAAPVATEPAMVPLVQRQLVVAEPVMAPLVQLSAGGRGSDDAVGWP